MPVSISRISDSRSCMSVSWKARSAGDRVCLEDVDMISSEKRKCAGVRMKRTAGLAAVLGVIAVVTIQPLH